MGQRIVERWGGLSFITVGLATALLNVLHPDQTRPGALADQAWVPVHMLGALVTLPELLGWFGVFARHGRLLGRAAPIALAGVIVATVAGGTDQLIEAFLPAQAHDLALQRVNEVRDGLGWPLWPLTLAEVAGSIAVLVVAVMLYRRGAPPRVAWLALAFVFVGSLVAVLVIAVAMPELIWPAIVITGVVSGAIFVWIGASLHRLSLSDASSIQR